MDRLRVCHTERSKSEREKRISDINVYTWDQVNFKARNVESYFQNLHPVLTDNKFGFTNFAPI